MGNFCKKKGGGGVLCGSGGGGKKKEAEWEVRSNEIRRDKEENGKQT